MDLTFTITGTMIGGLIVWVVARYLENWIKEKMQETKARREAFEAHIRDCNKKNEHMAQIDTKIEGLSKQAEEDKCDRRWLGDCVVAIGSKMDVRLPERP